MATIKAIEASSVHQIQSGQIIVDLCSVAKELVENGLDAGATSIEVRFKNQGLNSIEVQDNGSGISPENYESLALKHYTSKLSTYSDLSTLETFGFRGEALSSLCALSRFTVVTCLPPDVPKGTKLEFDTSGKIKGKSLVAAQKGTTISVENLFHNLPVRRRELERNIKREWGKVVSLLNQYACVQTGVKFTVSQQPNKGKRIVIFSTKGNMTTRENIINVFGAKSMAALVVLELKLELEPTSGPSQRRTTQENGSSKEVLIRGYVSRPAHGEGRQTPDRQMFYVNGRPCGLPQFAKVFNEVYRSYNSSQSPFIFADIRLDTHLYDVNVSPDKRTILLHDQGRMLDNLRDSLTELFEKQEYTVPISRIATFKPSPFKKLTISRQDTADCEEKSVGGSSATLDKASNSAREIGGTPEGSEDDEGTSAISRMKNLASAKALSRDAQVSDLMTRYMERSSDPGGEPKPVVKEAAPASTEKSPAGQKNDVASKDDGIDTSLVNDGEDKTSSTENSGPAADPDQHEDDFLTRLAKLKRSYLPEGLQDEVSDSEAPEEPPIPAITKPVKPPDPAPLSVSSTPRPSKRPSREVATITIGDHTMTSVIGTPSKRLRRDETAGDQRRSPKPTRPSKSTAPLPSFGGRLTQMFAAAASKQQLSDDSASLRAEVDQLPEGVEHIEEEDSGSEAIPGSCLEADADSDSGDARSLSIFLEQDEDGRSSKPGREKAEGVYHEEDPEHFDEETSTAQEDLKVQKVITDAEEVGHKPSDENQKRTQAFLKGGGRGKHSTQTLLQRLDVDEELLQKRLRSWESQLQAFISMAEANATDKADIGLEAENPEEKLSLIMHKGDFGKMKIVGQFNLGFILAVRPSAASIPDSGPSGQDQQHYQADDDELFIIDQHASDEKFNFERLQSTTVVQSQRLVRPKQLELTAVEEEIVIENKNALETNGFVVEVDESGDEPVGSRCRLLSLPLSRETTFSLADLEELISLLGENPTTATVSSAAAEGDDGMRFVPRPSKVQKMFAMRACRSSIMIGKALSHQQMEKVVRHMGDMEKPWNCPHGRPTMRHLCGLGGAWDEKCWGEGNYDVGSNVVSEGQGRRLTDYAGYVKQMRDR